MRGTLRGELRRLLESYRYVGQDDRFEQAITDFAETYADQNERDHRGLLDAVDAGRVEARTGV